MDTGRSNLCIGAAFALSSLLLLLVVTPLGVEVPTTSMQEVGSVTPRFFPNFVSGLMLVFSLCLVVIGLRRMRRAHKVTDGQQGEELRGIDWKQEACRVVAMFTPFALYFTVDALGIVLSSGVLYLLFAAYTGERRCIRAVVGAALCTALLYYFFVHVADVPMPTGTLFSG